MDKKLKPVHPGEVLLEEFLKPMGVSQNHLALKIGVPARRINEIVLGKRRKRGIFLSGSFRNSASIPRHGLWYGRANLFSWRRLKPGRTAR